MFRHTKTRALSVSLSVPAKYALHKIYCNNNIITHIRPRVMYYIYIYYIIMAHDIIHTYSDRRRRRRRRFRKKDLRPRSCCSSRRLNAGARRQIGSRDRAGGRVIRRNRGCVTDYHGLYVCSTMCRPC